MRTNGIRRRSSTSLIIALFGLALFGAMLVLGGCAHEHPANVDADSGVDAYPSNYKSDILAAMHAYLNDPTGIRDGSVSPPVLKPVGGINHYVACVRFSAKKNGNVYDGVKEIAGVFIAGRLDHFLDPAPARPLCAGVSYAPFPELAKLPP